MCATDSGGKGSVQSRIRVCWGFPLSLIGQLISAGDHGTPQIIVSDKLPSLGETQT